MCVLGGYGGGGGISCDGFGIRDGMCVCVLGGYGGGGISCDGVGIRDGRGLWWCWYS